MGASASVLGKQVCISTSRLQRVLILTNANTFLRGWGQQSVVHPIKHNLVRCSPLPLKATLDMHVHTHTHSLSLKLRNDTIPSLSVSSQCWSDLWINYRWVSDSFSSAGLCVCVGFFFFFFFHSAAWVLSINSQEHTWAQFDFSVAYSTFHSAVQFTSSKRYMDLLISYGILMFTFNQMLHGSNQAGMVSHHKKIIYLTSAFYHFMQFWKKMYMFVRKIIHVCCETNAHTHA